MKPALQSRGPLPPNPSVVTARSQCSRDNLWHRVLPRARCLAARIIVLILLSFLAIGFLGAANGQEKSAALTSPPIQAAQLRGRIVCLAEEMNRRHGVELPTGHEHLWGFRTDRGDFYTLLRTKISEALFVDERLREKELLLKVQLFPRSQIIEVTTVHSVRNGVVHDLYYYCDVCSIKSVTPEICVCCRDPVRLVEKPLSERNE